MANTLTPNMSLIVPTIGSELAPTWAQDINSSLSLVDGHDHSSGRGVQIGTAGINIQSDLTLNGNNLTSIRALRMSALSLGSLSASDNAALCTSGVDLYFRDGNGNNIRLTQSGSIVGTAGSISGLASPASASYVAGSSTFIWQSAANTTANMDMGSIILRPTTASANGITVSAPVGLGANYTLTLPGAVPGTNNALTLTSTSGAQTFLSLGAANQVLRVNSAGTALQYSTVDAANITSGTITGTQVSSNINLPGKAVQENGNNLVVSNTNATNSLAIVRGSVDNTQVITSGEGFSVSGSSGNYLITFTTAFGDLPAVTVTATNQSTNSLTCQLDSPYSTSQFRVQIRDSTNRASSNSGFAFIAIGQRA